MAGAGYKLFNTGDVLLASEVNTYLMQQTVMSFADSSARTTALSGVLAEGMVSYLRDTNVVEIYNGSSWASLDDPNAIQNTIVDAKGDLIAASADNTPARLAVGNNGETIVADSSTSTGLRYQDAYAAGKNRFINGGMEIDQRNGGASNTPVDSTYFIDRILYRASAASKFTAQQVTDAPNTFSNSLKMTVASAVSAAAGNFYFIRSTIEGYNVANFAFGTASAKNVAVSFWVKSSLTGTFGATLTNGAFDRSYAFTYTILAANTWQQVSISIPGDTSGTWLKANNMGMFVQFDLGSGSNFAITANSWQATGAVTATGATALVATGGATWQVTGVQVELGNVATAFTRAGGTIQGELAACQRYYQRFNQQNDSYIATGIATSTTVALVPIKLPVTMRVNPVTLDTGVVGIKEATGTFYNSGTLVLLGQADSNTALMFYTHGSGVFTQFRTMFFGSNNSTGQYFGISAEF